jgi:hypothetical protein
MKRQYVVVIETSILDHFDLCVKTYGRKGIPGAVKKMMNKLYPGKTYMIANNTRTLRQYENENRKH